MQGSVGVVSLLLARGLDEGHRDNAGWTPLHYAAFEGHEDVCETLIEAGARIGDIDNDGKHALLLASQEGHLNVVEKLVNYGCDLDLHSHDGRTSLRAAATEGFKDIVQVICSRGGNLNYRDSEGRSTLYLLALECRLGMAHILIRHGADVETRDFEGRTPLHISAWQGHFEMVELLVSAGANVNAADKDNRTPLQSASWQGHANIVRLLCERGSDVDHVCNQGATALCIAAQEGYIECVKVLLEYAADPRREDFFRRTPIRVALKSGHSEISRLLNEVARNKPAIVTETTVLDMIQCFDKPDANSQLYSGVGRSDLSNPVNMSSAHSDYNVLQCPPEAETPLRDSNFNDGSCNVLPPTAKPGGPGNTSLSFTQQVQQISRHNYRPKGRDLQKSYMNGHDNPSNKTNNTQDYGKVLNNRVRSALPPSLNKVAHNVNFKITSTSQTNSMTPAAVKSNSDNSAHPFAFTRDSHMKIILGSSSEHPINSRGSIRNGVGINSSNGISSATTVIRSGLIALKAGVMEAAAGRKILHDQTTRPCDNLVSAASLAVPHMNKSAQNVQVSNFDRCSPGKKETQL